LSEIAHYILIVKEDNVLIHPTFVDFLYMLVVVCFYVCFLFNY